MQVFVLLEPSLAIRYGNEPNPETVMPLPPTTPILIVDDEWMMAEVMTAILQKLQFHGIDVAADGASALKMMRQKAYGLVISDLNMTPVNGLALLRAIRSDQELKATPFILTTTSEHTESVVAAKRAGVTTFLLKPFTVSQLSEKIEALRQSPLS